MDRFGIEELAARLAAALPPGAQQLREDAEARFRQLLARAFARMDLVTREEFDAQRAVLERATAQLETLLRRLEELERR